MKRNVRVAIFIAIAFVFSSTMNAQGKTSVFESTFGISSGDQNAKLIVHVYINHFLTSQACNAVMAYEKSPNNEFIVAWKNSAVQRLRNAVDVAKKEGIDMGLNTAGGGFLDMYNRTSKEVGGTISCN